MPSNEYRLIVELPKSDRFHTTDDRHLASIVEAVVRRALRDHGYTDVTVRSEKVS